jgi:heat shock protein HslJ
MNRITSLFLAVFFGLFLLLSVDTGRAADAVMCPMNYAPVCGKVQVQCITAPCTPVEQTFGNMCMANAAKAADIQQGECGDIVVVAKKTPKQALQAGEWKLVSFNGKDMKSSQATITFEKKRFSAKFCNTMGGQYGVIGGSRILFRNVFSTMMYCEGDIMTAESALSRGGMGWFAVGEHTLSIITKKGDVYMYSR